MIDCLMHRVNYSMGGYEDVCSRHEHPERSIKASELDDDGCIRLLAAICDDMSDGSKEQIAKLFGLK